MAKKGTELTEGPHEYKTIPAFEMKIDADKGIVEHLVSVFGVLDLGGDITHPGSCTKTISERAGSIRVLDSHQRFTTQGVVGVPIKLWEVPKGELPADVLEKYPEATGGLMAETQFLMGEDTPEGRGAFARIKAGAVKEFSFAYDALDFDHEKIQYKGKDVSVRNLRTIRLWEYGPVVFGMNPAARAVSAKGLEDPEMKPAPEETENTIRVRVKDPSGFQKDSFRTITIGKKGKGIQAVIGRLKGETSTTIQSYIFSKPKWTMKTARAWIKEHRQKVLNLTRTIDLVRGAFRAAYARPSGEMDYYVREVFDTHLVISDWEAPTKTYFKVPYTMSTTDGVEFSPRAEWVAGDYVFVARKREKAHEEVSITEIEIEQSLIEIELAKTEAGPV